MEDLLWEGGAGSEDQGAHIGISYPVGLLLFGNPVLGQTWRPLKQIDNDKMPKDWKFNITT